MTERPRSRATPTILDRAGLPSPTEMMGKVVQPVSPQPRRRVFRSGSRPVAPVDSAESEQLIHERLKALGYVE